MTDLAELQQHVKSVGEQFIGRAEEDRKRSERVSRLLGVVEESFARSQQEIERSNEDLACANDEVQQLRTMLQALLAVVKDTGARGAGTAMRELEDQANRLVEAATGWVRDNLTGLLSGIPDVTAGEIILNTP